MLANSPRTSQYGHYVDNHFRELIDQFQPSVLWNDIAYPIEGNLKDLIAYYYNTISDGVVNDRWTQIPKVARFLEHSIILKYIINKIAQKVVKSSGFEGKPPRGIGDYCTPEYAPSLQLHSYKWECCRGIGRSFGFNRMETAEHYLSNETLIHSFIDIVSKNGNLLLNIGPQANGEIPPLQKERLLALGNWLTKFGGAIFDTSPWSRPTAITREQTHIRFTTKGKDLFLIVLRPPRGSPVIIPELKIHPESKAFIGDTEDRTQWRQIGSELELQEPNLLDEEYAYTIRFQNALLD